MRTIISNAAIKRLKVWTKEADQAFTQVDGVTRYIVIKPSPEFGVAKDVYLRLLRYLYGLSENEDAFHFKLMEAILKRLNMIEATGDQALYYTGENEGEGLLGTYFDDLLFAGDEVFE